jgi:hypothetical protein
MEGLVNNLGVCQEEIMRAHSCQLPITDASSVDEACFSVKFGARRVVDRVLVLMLVQYAYTWKLPHR